MPRGYMANAMVAHAAKKRQKQLKEEEVAKSELRKNKTADDRKRLLQQAPIAESVANSQKKTRTTYSSYNALNYMLVLELEYLFDLYDTDHSGCIDVLEASNVMRAAGVEVNADDVQEVFRDMDIDGNKH